MNAREACKRIADFDYPLNVLIRKPGKRCEYTLHINHSGGYKTDETQEDPKKLVVSAMSEIKAERLLDIGPNAIIKTEVVLKKNDRGGTLTISNRIMKGTKGTILYDWTDNKETISLATLQQEGEMREFSYTDNGFRENRSGSSLPVSTQAEEELHRWFTRAAALARETIEYGLTQHGVLFRNEPYNSLEPLVLQMKREIAERPIQNN